MPSRLKLVDVFDRGCTFVSRLHVEGVGLGMFVNGCIYPYVPLGKREIGQWTAPCTPMSMPEFAPPSAGPPWKSRVQYHRELKHCGFFGSRGLFQIPQTSVFHLTSFKSCGHLQATLKPMWMWVRGYHGCIQNFEASVSWASELGIICQEWLGSRSASTVQRAPRTLCHHDEKQPPNVIPAGPSY